MTELERKYDLLLQVTKEEAVHNGILLGALNAILDMALLGKLNPDVVVETIKETVDKIYKPHEKDTAPNT